MASIQETFEWAIPISDEEKSKIWEKAILTVDTNVLLDLYRFHPETTEQILNGIKSFQGRVWLSHQVASEFFKNRNKVILDAEKNLIAGKEKINSLSKEVESTLNKALDTLLDGLSSNRTISKKLIDNLKNGLKEKTHEFAKLSDDIIKNFTSEETTKVTPQKDDILLKIIEIFDKNLGDSFGSKSDKETLINTAKERYKNKIPPGYKDENKEDNTYGDFFLWEQILRYAEKEKKSIILVTSEQKEDWWEKISGKNLGLRHEMKEEAFSRLDKGNKVLVYQTTNFLQTVHEKYESLGKGRDKDKIENDGILDNALAEIRMLEKERSRSHEAFESIRLSSFQENHEWRIAKNINQQVIYASEYFNFGYLICDVTRPVRHFTISGKFSPNLIEIPILTVHLEQSPIPYAHRNSLSVHAGTGKNYDFNINTKATMHGISLLPGRYVFKYFAYTEIGIDNDELICFCPECGSYTYLKEIGQCVECEFQLSTSSCQLCGNDIDLNDIGCYPLCGHCYYFTNEMDSDDS